MYPISLLGGHWGVYAHCCLTCVLTFIFTELAKLYTQVYYCFSFCYLHVYISQRVHQMLWCKTTKSDKDFRQVLENNIMSKKQQKNSSSKSSILRNTIKHEAWYWRTFDVLVPWWEQPDHPSSSCTQSKAVSVDVNEANLDNQTATS